MNLWTDLWTPMLLKEREKPFNHKDYVFDVEIKKDNIVKTILKGILNLTEEVTFACNSGEK